MPAERIWEHHSTKFWRWENTNIHNAKENYRDSSGSVPHQGWPMLNRFTLAMQCMLCWDRSTAIPELMVAWFGKALQFCREGVLEMAADPPQLRFADAAAFTAWVADQPADSPGVWLSVAKKGNSEPSVTKPEAIEIALCHGWIDGQLRPLDDLLFLTRFTPRRARSIAVPDQIFLAMTET